MYREFRLSLKPFEVKVTIQKGTLWFYVYVGAYYETKDRRIAFDLFYKGKGKDVEKIFNSIGGKSPCESVGRRSLHLPMSNEKWLRYQ
jgi:hypothetical protein